VLVQREPEPDAAALRARDVHRQLDLVDGTATVVGRSAAGQDGRYRNHCNEDKTTPAAAATAHAYLEALNTLPELAPNQTPPTDHPTPLNQQARSPRSRRLLPRHDEQPDALLAAS
ncbi:MAG TPA: hypothetical protein VE127_16795, partial [Solirubrobacteraceae bacterium]|nr:hypothetical protein [Solirubrobacteraceae bacterium]